MIDYRTDKHVVMHGLTHLECGRIDDVKRCMDELRKRSNTNFGASNEVNYYYSYLYMGVLNHLSGLVIKSYKEELDRVKR